MSEAPSGPRPFEPLPESLLGSVTQSHEEVVMAVRDVTRDKKVTFRASQGADTGWRQVFPVTYDIVLDHPEAIETAEDDD